MIKAKSAILANGVTYQAGQLIDGLNEAQEKQLVDSGSASYDVSNVAPASPDAPVSAPATPAKPKLAPVPELAWTKVKLLGHARKLGLVVEDTMTKAEILKVIESNPQATEPKDDEGAEESTPPVTHLPENAPTIVPQAKDGGDEGAE